MSRSSSRPYTSYDIYSFTDSGKIERPQCAPDLDEALTCLANPIRRQILELLAKKRAMRFMDMSRHLGIEDHTKMNFHLKNLKSHNLVLQDQARLYRLTPQGEKMVRCLELLSQRISF